MDGETPHGDPTRVCPKCSTQTVTSGQYCPHCGASFIRRRRLGRRGVLVISIGAAILLLGGGGTATALKIRNDNAAETRRERGAAATARAARERREKAAAAERARQEREEQQRALDELELEGRKELEKALQKAVTKDAREKVSDGLLDGPILRTSCDPVGGGRDDLSSRTGKYECLAITETDADGTSRGYSFHATINYKEFTYSWGLGDA